jgi:hypothetical protein
MNSKTIIILVIITTVINVLVTVYNNWKNPITFNWRETFWHNKKFGIEVYVWNKDRTIGTEIFGFNFRKEPEDEK